MSAARLLLGFAALTVVAGPRGGGKGTHDLIKRL
jgi:hypothetical protein